MDWLGTTHLGVALLAMLAGLIVTATEKGTRLHKRAGWIYVVSMIMVNVTAMLIYDLFGRFGPFHFAAILSGITVVMGLVPALRRNPPRRWIEYHAYWMAGSYVGLLAAAAAEVFSRYIPLGFGLSVALASSVVIVIGVAVILKRVPPILKQYGIGL